LKNEINNKEASAKLFKNFTRANRELDVYFLAMVFFMTTDQETKSTWFFKTVKKIYELSIKHNMPRGHIEEIYRCLALKATGLDELLYTLSKFDSDNPNTLIKPNLQNRIRNICDDPCELLKISRKYITDGNVEFVEFVTSYASELIDEEIH